MINILKSKLDDIRKINKSEKVLCSECKTEISESDKEVWFLDDDAINFDERYSSGIVCLEQDNGETKNMISETFGYPKAFCCYGCFIGNFVSTAERLKKKRKLSNLSKL